MNSMQQTSLLTGAKMVLPETNYNSSTIQTSNAMVHKTQTTTVTTTSTATASQVPQATQLVIKREPGISTSSERSVVNRNNVNYTQNPASPTKTITLTTGGIISPQLNTNPTTPTKQIVPVGKIPISPIKTPTKFIISTTGGSPRKFGTGNVVKLMSKPNVAGSNQRAVTGSPTKVVIKHQPNTIKQAQKIMASTSAVGPVGTSSIRGGVVPAGVQPLPVAGSKFQYVRLVTTSTAQPQTATKVVPGPVSSRPIAPAQPMKISMSAQHQQPMQISRGVNHASGGGSSTSYSSSQRLILPATSHPVPIQPQPTTIMPHNMSSNYSSGQATASNTGLAPIAQGTTCFALVPAQYVTQVQPQVAPQPAAVKQESFLTVPNLPSQQSSATTKTVSNGPTHSGEGGAARPKKACNCTKSQCLKLYCDCFANGEFCSNCNCTNCYNNLDHEEDRQRAIKACLERNPLAFHPKIGKTKGGGGMLRRHNKGCNCKRSGCLKNYCECYEAKILCSSLCKCVGCKNFEESPDRKTLMHLADAAEVRVQQQTAVETKTEDLPTPVKHSTAANSSSERLAYTFVTEEVIEASCACMLAQAEEAERTRQNDLVQERLILQEFGRCLLQVIEAANRTKAPSPL